MNSSWTTADCITTTKQSATKPCAYFLGYTVAITIDITFQTKQLRCRKQNNHISCSQVVQSPNKCPSLGLCKETVKESKRNTCTHSCYKIVYCGIWGMARHMPWCMLGSLTSGFLGSRWREKRSWHSRRMRNPLFHVSGKRPMRMYALACQAMRICSLSGEYADWVPCLVIGRCYP